MSRLFRLLLRLYPGDFRHRLGAAMAETFDEELAEARRRGRGAVLALGLRTLVRTPFLALEERARSWRDGSRSGSGLAAWRTDLGHAVRGLLRSPSFTLVTVLTVSLGVGATTSLYSIVDAMLLRPLPVREPDRLFRVQEERDRYLSSGMEGPRIPVERFQRLREALTGPVFAGLAGQNNRNLSMRADGPAFPAMGVIASGNYFDVLGIRPALGRFFSADDERAVVLGHRFWQGRFGGAADVIGRTVHLSGQPFTVVGVAPREFASTVGFLHVDFWVPIEAHGGAAWPGARVAMFGRLAPGVGVSTAEQRMGAVVRRMPSEQDPEAELRGARLTPLTPTPPSMAGPLKGFLAMLFGTAVLVLLIAGANVAGMLVARAARRSREIAVRLALGVGRGRLIRQSMLETVGLFTLGGIAGMGIALAVTGALGRIRLPTSAPVAVETGLDPSVSAFALGIAVMAGILFGWTPALYASRSDVSRALRDGGRGSSERGSWTRTVFVTLQLALSVVLLVAATLFIRTAYRGMTRDPGFSAERVIVARIDLSAQGYGEEEGRLFHDRLLERVRALPGVEEASLAELAMLTGESSNFGGWRLRPEDTGLSAGQNAVDHHYFQTLGVELLAGRAIDEGDVEGAPPVAVVNEGFARRFWPGENPVGKTVLRGDQAVEVVGLTRDGAYVEFGRETPPFTFLPAAQHYSPRRTIHLRYRTGEDPVRLIDAVREVVASMDADVAVEQAMPLKEAIGSLLFPQRFAASLIGVFGLLGLFLAATGVYGLLAHLVVQRTREFGIRIALGARTIGLLVSVLRRGGLLTMAGTFVGLVIAAALTRLLAGLLHGVSPLDPVAFVGVPILLALVALVASALPARRVLGVDPVEALRRE